MVGTPVLSAALAPSSSFETALSASAAIANKSSTSSSDMMYYLRDSASLKWMPFKKIKSLAHDKSMSNYMNVNVQCVGCSIMLHRAIAGITFASIS